MMRSLTCGILGALVLFAGCADDVTQPGPPGQAVSLEAEMNRTVVTLGSPAVVTFRLRNNTSRTVSLSFSSSCQILPYIETAAARTLVYPPGGEWACAAVISFLTLPQGRSELQQTLVGALGEPQPVRARLPPGEYAAFARVDSAEYQLRSPSVMFRVE